MAMTSSDILFTRQKHDADRAGLHYDIRLVQGDKAYSWATKKEMPEVGQAIMLYEQPVHTKDYAMRQRIVIPKGNYGSGTTVLDFVRKAKVIKNEDKGHYVLESSAGERYLLKPLPTIQGGKSWLFKRLADVTPETKNKYIDKIASDLSQFAPDLTPEQMERLGVLEGKYTKGDPLTDNYFKVDASMKSWPETWHNDQHPLGWFEWYKNYSKGVRTDDDSRQMKRWISFKARHLAQLKKADPTLQDLSIQPRRRQALLNWGIAPGILLEKASLHIHQYQDKDSNTKWFAEGKPIPEGYTPTGVKFYKRKGMTKTAKEDKSTKTRPHTERALRKLEATGGLVADHSMGSGKTLLYLKAIERMQKKDPSGRTLYIAPASLTTNFDKEVKKHKVKIDTSKVDVLSYEKAVNSSEKLSKNKYALAVLDEAHKMRNAGTRRSEELTDLVINAKQRLLGTGTSVYNHPSDIAPLVNMAAGEKVLPEGKASFENRYVSKIKEQPPILQRILGAGAKEHHVLRNKKELSGIMRKYMDHYDLADDPSAKGKFPEKIEKAVEIEMAPSQLAMYKYMEGKLPFHLRMKVRMNMPLDKQDTAKLQAFSSGIRQVSNSLHPYMPSYEGISPKVMTAVNNLEKSHKEDKNFRGLVYSNYLEAGVHDYSKELTRRGIKHALYTGALTPVEKDKLVEEYNSGKNKVLLVSSSGAEGLNLKGTKKVQILEPHFNDSKIKQVVARGIRYESHEHLPKNERKVEVEHYFSILPKRRFNFGPQPHSIDQYLRHNSKTKEKLGDEMKELIKQKPAKPRTTKENLVKKAFALSPHVFERAKYNEADSWDHIKDPVGSIKRDGAAFFMHIGPDGSPNYYSRRPSVRGGYPDRTEQLPQLTRRKLLDYANDVYHVELVHTGHSAKPGTLDSHPTLSGILNSKKERSIATQKEIGPVRAVLLDVIAPKIGTYGEKLKRMQEVAKAYGKSDILQTPDIKIGKAEIAKLIESTKKEGHEGVIVTSLTQPEEKNTRLKVKHVDTYNLKIVGITQEKDINGNLKDSAGALIVEDGSGKIVANVGTGFTSKQRAEIWKNKEAWLQKGVQVKAMPSTAERLRAPVYNGLGDGEIDIIGKQ